MKRLALLAALALAGCGDNNVVPPPDAGEEPADAGVEALAPCLDRPTDLPRPPTGGLPSDLLPPGFAPSRGTYPAGSSIGSGFRK